MPNNRSLRAIEDLFPEFAENVRSRLKVGAVEYGDKSFDKPLPQLIGEIEQELFDVLGWSFILYTRLQGIKATAEAAERARR